MLSTFKKFIKDDKNGWEMFVTGQAGTGKTTELAYSVQYCIDNNIKYHVVAYTHKACDILRAKLPEGASIGTLHAFLKKRPTINQHATDIRNLNQNTKQGISDTIEVLFLDEYSMLGEKDYMDIGLLQDPDDTGKPMMRVVYIGDPNQLAPINDAQAIRPSGKYCIVLTKVYRQKDGNKLLDTLTTLVEYINGSEPMELPAHDTFIKGVDLAKEYRKCKEDKVLLAYTNERVQDLNARIAGKVEWDNMDKVFSPTTKQYYTALQLITPIDVSYIMPSFGDDPIQLNTKYKTLEFILRSDLCNYILLEDEDGNEEPFAYIFGHYKYNQVLKQLGEEAVETNKVIEAKYKMPAKIWAMQNKNDSMSRARAQAWRRYLVFKECVICIDFPYAMTVHKSQGSTFNTVFIDTKDLSRCADISYSTYLRLMYVAISRASNKVYTN